MKAYEEDGKIIIDGEGFIIDTGDENSASDWLIKYVEWRNFRFEGKFKNVSMSTRIRENASEYV
jgi:hypothetical protein